jgi:thiol-disulfide isomerase/thioredoxin
MKRGARVALIVGGLLVAQLGAYAVYRTVEAGRVRSLATTPPVQASGETGPFVVRDAAGESTNLGELEEATVVHFWATWCEPCREELPALLDLADRGGLRIIAVSLDDDWAKVHEMLGDRRSPSLFLGSPDVAKRQVGVQTLPVTFLIGPAGVLRLRADGARDWRSAEFVSAWEDAAR